MSPSSNREQSASATAALSNQCAPSPSHQFFFCGKISSHLQQQWFKATYLMAKDLLVLHRLFGFYFYQLQLSAYIHLHFASWNALLDVLIWRRTSYLAAHTNVLFSKRHVWLCKCSLRRSATTSSAKLVCLAIHAMAAWRSQGLLAAHELVGIWISRYYNDISVFFHEAGEIYSMSELLSYASICT
uniref:Uncharacterized protein n=1 Tax=Oryza nivara TaxID=4536 RepID=A0A0E0IQH7_ORYNI